MGDRAAPREAATFGKRETASCEATVEMNSSVDRGAADDWGYIKRQDAGEC